MKFSVVIPTYNRITSLRKNLASLTALESSDFEIIVVNDGSTDGTEEYLAKMPAGGKIRSRSGSHQGPAAARNAGVAVARGEWIAFTDDDCTVSADWLSRFEAAIGLSGADVIGGSVVNGSPDFFFAELSQEMLNHYVATLPKFGRREFLTSNNIVYRASVLRNEGGFDERFRFAGGEERDLNRRILAHGGTAAFYSDISVNHAHTMNVLEWLRQQCHYGRGACLLARLSRLRGEQSPAIPLAAHLSLCRTWVSRDRLRGCIKVGMFVIAQLATLIGYIAEQAGI
jgi:glycosyltransferase involved in cell wall biosynthesis